MGEEKNIDSLHVIDLSIYVFLSRRGRKERKKNSDRVKYISAPRSICGFISYVDEERRMGV